MTAAVYLFLIIFVVLRYFLTGNKKGGNRKGPAQRSAEPGNRGFSASKHAGGSGRGPVAADGHRVPGDQDISCRRFGHNHEEFDTPRYIPHSDPEEGYIILNGVKMRLSDADRYEDRI